jgi:ABC-type nitrate/sulfonate/bicarbonate transport system permease component
MKRFGIGLALIVGVWALFYYTGVASPQILPSPLEAGRRLWDLISSGKLNPDLAASGRRWGLGFLLGVLVGSPVGLAMGYSRRCALVLSFPVDFFRSLPVTALFPVFLLAFGIQDASKIAMVATAVAFVMVVTASYGVQHAPRTRQLMAQVFGASPRQRFVDVVLPEAVGQIASGMRVSLGTSLVVVVVAEMFIGGRFGLGTRLYDTYSINAVADMYGVLALVGMIGYLLNVGFVLFERRIVFWVGR